MASIDPTLNGLGVYGRRLVGGYPNPAPDGGYYDAVAQVRKRLAMAVVVAVALVGTPIAAAALWPRGDRIICEHPG